MDVRDHLLLELGHDGFSRRDLFELEGFGHLALRVPGKQAEEAWERLLERAPRMGFYPVIVGDEEAVRELVEFGDVERAADADGAIGRSRKLDPTALLTGWSPPGDEEYEPLHCDWPPDDIELRNRIAASHHWEDGKAHREVSITFVQAMSSWQVPAFFGFGHFNGCPTTEEHLAMLRLWHEHGGGIELASIKHDTIEVLMRRPPATREEAMRLALEHNAYCPDIVSQGCGYIESLAASLMESRYALFWWD
jgi:hypothetical protein